jgi:hypothetical protein
MSLVICWRVMSSSRAMSARFIPPASAGGEDGHGPVDEARDGAGAVDGGQAAKIV